MNEAAERIKRLYGVGPEGLPCGFCRRPCFGASVHRCCAREWPKGRGCGPCRVSQEARRRWEAGRR